MTCPTLLQVLSQEATKSISKCKISGILILNQSLFYKILSYSGYTTTG